MMSIALLDAEMFRTDLEPIVIATLLLQPGLIEQHSYNIVSILE